MIFGVLTTILNFLLFLLLIHNLNINNKIATIISIFASICFAYITNKIWVFESRDFSSKVVFKELYLFFSGRAVTFVLELGLFILLVDFMHIDQLISKMGITVVVVILNYFFSKKGAFNKKLDI